MELLRHCLPLLSQYCVQLEIWPCIIFDIEIHLVTSFAFHTVFLSGLSKMPVSDCDKSLHSVMQLCHSTNLPRQLSIFHQQTVAIIFRVL